MAISRQIAAIMEKSSWIRRMFEEGAKLKAELGAENVYDFTLGNPSGEPPDAAIKRLAQLAADPAPGAHRYMPNAGYPDVRERIAGNVSNRTGLAFTADHIIMTCGAGGALNVIIKSLADPGDEVIIAAPFFAEYMFYAGNHGAKIKVAETDDSFQLIPLAIEEAIGPKTRILLLNSPNNPTGAVYSKEALAEVGDILEAASKKHGRPIYMVMDEPYRKLTFDGVEVPDVFKCYSRTIAATSHSKDLNLPGERIGFISISPQNEETVAIAGAMTLSNRILGFVNAPAIFQRLAADMQDVTCDMSGYEENRKILMEGLTKIGYEAVNPGGGFYIFPKSPVKDEMEFVAELKKHNILVVPGSGFGRAGHFRIAFCCPAETCRAALPGFEKAYRAFK